jgi:Domain of unknown function (DUF4124)
MVFVSEKLLALTLGAMLSLGAASLHAAGLVKWVDEKGVTHYGDSVPPEYASRETKELSNQGIVIKKTEGALTSEQRKAKAEQAQRDTVEQKKTTELQRRDSALFNTYTSEKEIDVAKERTLQQVEAKLLVISAQLKANIGLQDELIKQLAPYAAKGLDGKYVRIAPMTLVLAYEKNEADIKGLSETLRQFSLEKEQTIAKFEADKNRYLELKKSVAAAANANK